MVTKITNLMIDNNENGVSISGRLDSYFGKYGVDDALDYMRYATTIVEPDGHICKMDSKIQVDYDYTKYYNMLKEKQIKNAFNSLEGEDCCEYCRYKDECHGMTSNGRGEPVYPACADMDVDDYLDYEAFKEEYLDYEVFKKDCLGEFKEENFMKVLDIYKERKYKELKDLFKQKEKDVLDNNKYIKEYNEIVNEFSAKLEEFATRTDVKAEEMLVQTGYKTGAFAYEIRDSYEKNLMQDLITEYNQEKAKLEKCIDEVKAIIELIPAGESYDAKVIEVLKNYEILDKKGKINA